jgi:ribosome-binding protein aMBF1 (putative translation factor)
MTIRPEQVKAARELLGWTRPALAKRVWISSAMVAAIETGRARSAFTLHALKKALEEGGVEITPWSVKLRDERLGLG